MIETIFYFLILTIFLKVNFFKKYWDMMGFRSNVALTMISIAVFVYTCTQIILNPNYVFGMNFESKNLRVSVLLIFIASFVTLYGFTLSHRYYKHALVKTAPIGDKGNRGDRGTIGDNKICKPLECQKDICYKRMMTFLTRIYTNYLRAKAGPDGSSTDIGQFSNKFILNKVRQLCRSDQLTDMIKKKGADKAYLYVQNTWKKWLHIILKYERGVEFLENEYLNDNDYDNLITDSDRLYANFNNITEPGTPSKGVESPFDEIKKFDMWYWGSTLKAMPKVVYKCDMDTGNTLKMLESNRYETMWRSSIARQAYINRGYYENGTCIQKMKFVPFLKKGSEKITAYRPETVEYENETYKPLGDVVISGDIKDHYKSSIEKLKPRDSLLQETLKTEGSPEETTTLVAGDIKEPIGFKKKYESVRRRGVGIGVNGYSFWEPIPPEGYVCLGDMIDNDKTITEPEASSVACVPKVCVRKNKAAVNKVWTNQDNVECMSDCNCDEEMNHVEALLDTDADGNSKPVDIFRNANNLFKINKNEFYELIPSGEKGDGGEPSCFDAEAKKMSDNSRWEVNPKNEKKYSIFNIYEQNKLK